LLFAANLLGILSGALIALAICQPELRANLWRSRLGWISLLLTALLLIPPLSDGLPSPSPEHSGLP
jgi:hypothetical protein